MFPYIKEYNMADMKKVIANGKRKPLESTESMKGRLCIITGATSGVGKEAARRLHGYGADLVVVNRNDDKAEALIREIQAESSGGGFIRHIRADFSLLEETRHALGRILQLLEDMKRPLDVLIHNAGIHMTRRELTVEGHEKVFAVNHLSPFLITRSLLPVFEEQNSGRIILVNSQGHRFSGLRLDDLDWSKRPYIGLRGYGAAKTAQLLCCWETADALSASASRVSINAMHPGAVRSSVGMNNGRLYRWFQNRIVQPGLDDPEISGIALHWLASDPSLDNVSGRYFNLTTEEKPAPHALDREVGKKIYDMSMELTDAFLPSTRF
ncbi:SDR family NAD(P)-dependent oxidoreductase [Salinispira pacifica]|uniref:Putative oxidoreductase/Short-chain dehydrogenase n=1 Tax=Salinispira pacifica TaxID=1307761 RepID=V5WEK2_9SPIO|nr:SDR family NAD(P)-dependent oxidoreductase [Salinispira pacifica]AHC13989.1 putative oxidoreductase/Short-chain dehydrogenase [Salinispira pacifica]